MLMRLAAYLREHLDPLIVQYDDRLRNVPGYADLPKTARHDLEQRVLQLMADCLAASDDDRLIQYVHDRAEQALAEGLQPEWFQRAITIPQEILIALVETVEESNFVWRAFGRAQIAVWEIVARERRRAEMTLRESEARYQTIFDSTPIMFWLKDTHNRTLRINRAAAEFEGVQPAAVEGKSAYDLYPHEQAEAFFQDDLEVIRTNRPKLGIVEQHTSVGSGKLMWVETGKTPVHNEQGEVTGVLAFGIDVTERQQAEAKLRESEEQYRRTIAAAGAVPYYIDYPTESYRFIGEAIEKLTGYPAGEITPTLLGQMITETIMTGQGSTLQREEAIQQTRTGNLTSWNADYRLTDRSGQTHWLSDSSIQVLDELGKPIGAIGILQDITNRKSLEEQVRESLDRRGSQVQTSTEVAQEIASATDLNELFGRVVTLIKERFDYYHAQLFRYEPSRHAVVLITGYGEIGQKMLAGGHQLPMGRGVVGTAALTGKSILASDVKQDADWRPNPNLPQTQGELAVPIKWRDQVLGILDVQSDQAGALTGDDQLLLEGLCGQIAIAIESKRLLDSIQQSEQLMRTLIDAFPDYIYAKDLEGQHILGNAALARLYGLASPAELLGKTDFDFYSRELAEQYRASELPILQQGQSLLAHEEPNIGADGQQRWNSTTKVPLRDSQGQISGLVGITSDITQRKLAEVDLRKFKLGLDRSTAAIFMTNTNGIITYVNPAFETIYGFGRAEAVGQTPRILKSGLISQEQYQHFWQTLLAGQTVAGEIVNKTKDGRLIPVEGSNSAILDEDGNLIGFLALHTDITERKRAEQQMAETLRETERLYAAVSHEGWQAYRETSQLQAGYLFDRSLVRPADDVWEPEIVQALEQRTLVAARSEQRAVAVAPLAVRGETIGALGVHDDPAQPLSKDDLELIQAVSDQVALALESARLFDQNQRDAEREHTINRVTSRIRNARSVDEVLSIAAQELRTATRATRSVVEIAPAADQTAQRETSAS